jgi:hypothetical protein
VLDLLGEHEDAGLVPTNLRFITYELAQRGLVGQTKPGTRRSQGWPPGPQDITDAVMRLREEGVIPWSWIIDETRMLTVWSHAPTVRDYLVDRLEEASVNPWGEQSPPLMLCETGAMAGVLRPVVAEYCCPITATKGQVGGFLRTEVAPLLAETRSSVFYVGDLDKPGGDIEANTRRVLERDLETVLDWERIAITPKQVEELKIPPRMKVDKRTRAKTERPCWEAEALGQGRLVALVRETLDRRLPEPLPDVLERERAQREAIRDYLAAWEATG